MNSLLRSNLTYRIIRFQNVAAFSSEIPKNMADANISAHKQQDNGSVYDKKPFKMTLEAGKKYHWCLCGKSKTQPLCDGTHKMAQLKIKQKKNRKQCGSQCTYEGYFNRCMKNKSAKK